jgi:hypothetical protein
MTKILLITDHGEIAGIRASEEIEIEWVHNKSLSQFGFDDEVNEELEKKYPVKAW